MRQLMAMAILALLGLAAVAWDAGGMGPLASRTLRKETANHVPWADALRRLSARVVARRPITPDALAHLVRLSHLVEPDDPLWPLVVHAAKRHLAIDTAPDASATTTLQAIDAAATRVLGRPLDPRLGALAWQPLDPYFVTAVERLADGDPAHGAEQFNSLRTPSGLPTSEWYLDELLAAFDDPRPIAFVLVADTTGAGWAPMAFTPADVPEHARRIPATTVGEALMAGLWGLDDYRPETPATPIVPWWTATARARGLPTFSDQPDR